MADDDFEVSGSEAVFEMDPNKALRELARQFIDGQRTMAELTRAADKLRTAAADDPEVNRVLSRHAETSRQWLTEALPSIAASMQLALEVYETFGPGRITITDPTDAALWNNKYFVWAKEFSGRSRG